MTDGAEFSRPVAADEVGADAAVRNLEATEAECAALAERFGLVSLERLGASLTVQRDAQTGLINILGRLGAAGAQRCVVSLEPVGFEIDEPVACRFADDVTGGTEIEIDMEAEDPPEPVVENRIDLGELTAQQLAIALDPYPRAPGVEIPADGLSFGEKDAGAAENHPFAALRRLK